MRGGGGGVVNGAAVRAEFTSREEVGGEGAGWGRERAAAAAAASSSGGGCGCSACAAGGGGTGGGKGGRRRRGLTKGEASAGAGTARGGREGGREGRRAAGGGGPTTMPRVVPDQRSKFENEEFFRKLSRECEVRRRGSPFSPSLPPWVKFPRAAEGPGQPRTSSQLRREPSRRRGEAQSVHSAAPLSPGLAPPDCAPCSPQIKYTGFRDRPHEERQARFQNACRDGRSEIVSGAALPAVPAGTGPGRARLVK